MFQICNNTVDCSTIQYSSVFHFVTPLCQLLKVHCRTSASPSNFQVFHFCAIWNQYRPIFFAVSLHFFCFPLPSVNHFRQPFVVVLLCSVSNPLPFHACYSLNYVCYLCPAAYFFVPVLSFRLTPSILLCRSRIL